MAKVNEAFRHDVRKLVDLETVRREARSRAISSGSSSLVVAELDLIVSELGTNIIRHGGGGRFQLTDGSLDARACICILATDFGPGIENVPLALQAGYSTVGSLGHGLAMVQRLADAVSIVTGAWGTRVSAMKFTP